jgi:hypothetical protein
MYTTLDRIDIVTKKKEDGRAGYVLTDHRSADEIEAEPELSVLFALTRVSAACAMGEREGGADVSYVCRSAPPGFLREAVAAAGGVVSVEGAEEPPGVSRSVDDIADEAFRGLAARVAAREGASVDAPLLERLEDATLASPPRKDDDEGQYWARVLELGALCGELLRAKTGGRWTAARDRDGLFPFAFTAGKGTFNVVDRAHRFLDQGESQRPGRLVLMADDVGREAEGPPMLNLKPADFSREHGVCRPLLDAKGPAAGRIPLVFVGWDQPSSFAYLPAGSPDAERLFDEALANLAKLDLPAVAHDVGGVKVHVVSDHFYASEKILDRAFLRSLHRTLGAELLAAAVPYKGVLLVTERVAPPEIAGFAAVAAVLHAETEGAPQLSPVVFLIRDGEVVGHLETEGKPPQAKAAAPAPRRTAPPKRPTPRPAKPGFWSRLFRGH